MLLFTYKGDKMNDLIRIKGGALGDRAEMPSLQHSTEKGYELGYRTDTDELYIGSEKGNVRLCGAKDLETINKKIGELKARLDALAESGGEGSE